MTSIDDLRKLPTPPPTGWEPGLQWDGNTGRVTTPPMPAGETPDNDTWGHVLERFGLDPTKYMIDGPVRHSAWDVPGHGIQVSHRAQIVERPERSFDIEELISAANDTSPLDQTIPSPPLWRTVQIGDAHIGKGEIDGGGSQSIIDRWKQSVKSALGDTPGSHEGIHLAFLGDLIEGYVSQGGAMISTSDLTLSEQMRVARHMILWTIKRAVELAPKVIVSAVPGNHGQTTRVQNVPHTDSYDLDIISAVQQAIEISDMAGLVKFHYPHPGDTYVTYQVGDTLFTSVHGHLFKGKMAGAEKWISGMAVNNQPAGNSHIYMAGHYHSTQISNITRDKWVMFGPSLETKSNWYHQSTGGTSLPGVLAYDTHAGQPIGIGVF